MQSCEERDQAERLAKARSHGPLGEKTLNLQGNNSGQMAASSLPEFFDNAITSITYA